MFDCLAHILWQFIASISLFSEASSQYFRCLLMKDHLFMFKTTIMVNIREKKIYCIIPTNAILFLYFFNFNPFLLLFSSFFPIFFVLILWYLSRMCRTFSPLLDIFLSGTFFPGGGGGCTCTQCTPQRTRLDTVEYATRRLYFLCAHVQEPLGECVYEENTSDKWHVPRYPTIIYFIATLSHAKIFEKFREVF